MVISNDPNHSNYWFNNETSMRLELWFPAKPYRVTQAWGIYNPSYLQFGFSRHNGEDFRLGDDKKLYTPLKCKVTWVGENSGSGKFVEFISTDMWEVLGTECYVGGCFMHMEKQTCVRGQLLEVGDEIGIADNTGFSTGPHTHLSLYRLKTPLKSFENRLDNESDTNYTFDSHPYWNGYYAQDFKLVIANLNQQKSILARVVELLKWIMTKSKS